MNRPTAEEGKFPKLQITAARKLVAERAFAAESEFLTNDLALEIIAGTLEKQRHGLQLPFSMAEATMMASSYTLMGRDIV
jgi:hypothetical protein